MWHRVIALLRARLAAQQSGASAPLAAMFVSGFAAAVFCALVRGMLPPFAYALFSLSLVGALVAVPMLGELGVLLAHDEAAPWIAAQPIRPREIAVARALHVLIATWICAATPAIVAAAFAPEGFSLAARTGLTLAALGLATFVAAISVWTIALLWTRATGVLAAIQTAALAGAIVAAVLGVRWAARMSSWTEAPGAGLAWLPPVWFAVAFEQPRSIHGALAPLAIAVASLALLCRAPVIAIGALARSRGPLDLATAPLRALAVRSWVRRDERATFELVCEVLPREREFVLRTYPLVGVPLAFLALGMRADGASERAGWMSLILFTSATYLPVLVAHVAISRSHRARWILDTAPTSRVALDNGAFKALAVRWVAPLYVALAAICASNAELAHALHLVPVAFLVAIAVMRSTWSFCAADAPLSVAPESVGASNNWSNVILTLAVVLTLLAVAATKLLSPLGALIACAALIAIELAGDRSWRAADQRRTAST